MSRGRAGAWLALLVVALVGLLLLGARLPLPPLPDATATREWLAATDPAVVAFTLVRLVAILAVAHLLLTTTLELATAGRADRGPGRLATALTLPVARRLVRRACGAGLALGLGAAATALPAGAAPAAGPVGTAAPSPPIDPRSTVLPDPDAPPVLRVVPGDPTLAVVGPTPADPSGTASAPTDPNAPVSDPTTTERPAPSTAPARPSEGEAAPPGAADPAGATDRPDPGPLVVVPGPSPGPPPDPAGAPRDPAVPAGGPAPTGAGRPIAGGRYTIVAGDHLWGIAERALAAAGDRPPDAAAIAGYLQVLVAANRSMLAVPDDPDLVFPGQVVTLPALPVAARR